jgi:hypothetical protein
MEREEYLSYRCLRPPRSSFKVTYVDTNGATRYDKLAGGVGSAHQKVENPDST